jgi:hypothetical protein
MTDLVQLIREERAIGPSRRVGRQTARLTWARVLSPGVADQDVRVRVER